MRPLYVYDNWSAYDELSDNVLLTEELAMRQFEEICRLRRSGVQIDAYLMDAFWYAPEGGYRSWRKDRWPNGPDGWLEACRREGILPGLWLTANTAFHLDPPTKWRDSLAADGWGFSCSSGGFLAGFIDVLEHWYAQGVRVFKFDFADFAAAPAGSAQRDRVDLIRENVDAFRRALIDFRVEHPEAVILAYNGFEHTEYMPWTDRRIRPVLDPAWLTAVDTVYCGDPRPADQPLPSFWRTLDVYADAMVHLLHRGSGLELSDIDNCAFMIGRCGTCYRRGAEDWKTTALLSYARGGRVHVAMGNMDALSDEDARWLARVQAFYVLAGDPVWVGGNPGAGELYAYAAGDALTAVNPSLGCKQLVVGRDYRVVYSDGTVDSEGDAVTLGAGSVAVLGRGLAAEANFGTGPGGPSVGQKLEGKWVHGQRSTQGIVDVPPGADLHLVLQHRDADGLAVRTSGGSPPDGRSSAELLRIEVSQGGRKLNVQRPDDKIIWSGMSWAYGIVAASEISEGGPVDVVFSTDEPNAVRAEASAYAGTRRNAQSAL